MARSGGPQTKLERSSAAFRHPRPEKGKSGSRLPFSLSGSLRRHYLLAVAIGLAVLILGFLGLRLFASPTYRSDSVIELPLAQPLPPVEGSSAPHSAAAVDPLDTLNQQQILIEALHHLPDPLYGTGTEQEQADSLAADLQVQRIARSPRVRIHLVTHDATHIAAIANAVTQSYIDEARRAERETAFSNLNSLTAERDALLRSIQETEQAQSPDPDALTAEPVSAPARGAEQQLRLLKLELSQAQARVQEAETDLEAVRGLYSPELTAQAQDLAARNVSMDGLTHSLRQERMQLASNMATLPPASPQRRQLALHLLGLDGTLARIAPGSDRALATRLLQRYEQQVRLARLDHDQLAREATRLEAQSLLTTPTDVAAAPDFMALAQSRHRLAEINSTIQSLQRAGSEDGPVRLIAAAVPPSKLEILRETSWMFLLIPLAVFAGVGAAVLRDLSDKNLYSPEDVERLTGLPPVGLLFDIDEVTADIEDEYTFRIGATLDHAHRTAGVRTFAFTSVEAGGGTSTIVALIAAQMAQLGSRVLVLDAADMREPIAYIPPDPTDAHGVPHARTLHPELGLMLNQRGRLLPSVHSVTDAFRHSYGEYDVLLLDCAPLLASADTEYHARQADATLLIATSGQSEKEELVRAARLLERLRVPGLAIILNRLTLPRAGDRLRADVQAYVDHGRRLASFEPTPLPAFVNVQDLYGDAYESTGRRRT